MQSNHSYNNYFDLKKIEVPIQDNFQYYKKNTKNISFIIFRRISNRGFDVVITTDEFKQFLDNYKIDNIYIFSEKYVDENKNR